VETQENPEEVRDAILGTTCSYLLLNNSYRPGFINLTVCKWNSFNLAKTKLIVVEFLKIRSGIRKGKRTRERQSLELDDGSGHDWDMGTARLQALL